MYTKEKTIESYNNNIDIFRNSEHNIKHKDTSLFSKDDLPFLIDLNIIECYYDILSYSEGKFFTMTFDKLECQAQMFTHSYFLITDFCPLNQLKNLKRKIDQIY